jgi:hypothetical protein
LNQPETGPPPPGTPGEAWHTVPETAHLLGMSPGWVRDRISDGSLHARKITLAGKGQWRISDSYIAAFMDSRPDNATP